MGAWGAAEGRRRQVGVRSHPPWPNCPGTPCPGVLAPDSGVMAPKSGARTTDRGRLRVQGGGAVVHVVDDGGSSEGIRRQDKHPRIVHLHVGPDRLDRLRVGLVQNATVRERATQAGYRWRTIGENIATGQGAPKQVVAGWLASPQHCSNIMQPAFTEMGAAYFVNRERDTAIYWTQVFGTPR